MEIRIPNLGDGIESAIVISICVKPGETVKKDQTLIELETDKAVAPVPCPENGVIDSIAVGEGDTVATGHVIGAITTNGGSDTNTETPAPVAQPAVSAPTPVQVPQVSIPAPSAAPGVVVNPNPVTSVSLQKIAYRIGLDLTRIQGTGSGGRITEQDIQGHIQYLQSLALQPQSPSATTKAPSPLPDFSKWGEIEIDSLSSLRKKISDKMTETWQTVPHVTQQADIDITDIMALRKKHNPKYKKKNAKLTLTVFAIYAVQKALEKFPQFNASYDSSKNALIRKQYFHIGIAVDTPNGLIVPVIKDVDKKSILELCEDLTRVAEKARDRSLGVEDLQGSTFTISNLGGFGVGSFTPIINTPEVAILGLSSGELKPVVEGDKIKGFRLKMPVSLSYDHRVIDGADGARFITEVKEQFETFSEAVLKEI